MFWLNWRDGWIYVVSHEIPQMRKSHIEIVGEDRVSYICQRTWQGV